MEVNGRQRVVVLHSPLPHIQHPSQTQTTINFSRQFISHKLARSAVHTVRFRNNTSPNSENVRLSPYHSSTLVRWQQIAWSEPEVDNDDELLSDGLFKMMDAEQMITMKKMEQRNKRKQTKRNR
ncbi:hypothetical protein BLNAU_23553 [Blattamonas nauphoetae]|uniref:Uncharacterized protein n=1 Tax=Blattamonas nauphoetae TaxID=2049346 RepID=A0ABQ9WPX4_9EUKA|nr:hypothetical protein BLNAU_23553 [Blattamonas nauphoetae]